jgi:hypothetical protein
LSDIVERLGKKQRDWLVADELLQEARDEIVRLRAFLSATVETSDANGRRATAAEAGRDSLRDALRKAELVIDALCRAHETLRVHHGDLPNTSHAVADGRDFLAALKGDTPSWESLRGVAPDATGDLSSEAFIRQQRDEWDKTPALKGDTP